MPHPEAISWVLRVAIVANYPLAAQAPVEAAGGACATAVEGHMAARSHLASGKLPWAAGGIGAAAAAGVHGETARVAVGEHRIGRGHTRIVVHAKAEVIRDARRWERPRSIERPLDQPKVGADATWLDGARGAQPKQAVAQDDNVPQVRGTVREVVIHRARELVAIRNCAKSVESQGGVALGRSGGRLQGGGRVELPKAWGVIRVAQVARVHLADGGVAVVDVVWAGLVWAGLVVCLVLRSRRAELCDEE